MLQIRCPDCGSRDEIEFQCGGPAHQVRPVPYSAVSDRHWSDYLFLRDNPKGLHLERWVHFAGCRQWFNVARSTVDHRILAVYRMGEPPPDGMGSGA
jgi:heterotetrameric sarcosine oxidase delta subunit